MMLSSTSVCDGRILYIKDGVALDGNDHYIYIIASYSKIVILGITILNGVDISNTIVIDAMSATNVTIDDLGI